MPRFRPAQALAARQGVILLVVITLLTLFAVVGITFVIYAQSEANSMRAARQSEYVTFADADPEMLLAYFLGQLIYGPPDGVQSTLRNWDLARNMYGTPVCWYPNQVPSMAFSAGMQGTVPFNGIGRLQTPPVAGSYWNFNYSSASQAQLDQDGAPNVPYTYPDVNSLFLGAVRSSDGGVLIPSFCRWQPNPGGGYIWNTSLRALVPNISGQVAPEDGYCDVKNLPDSPGLWNLQAGGFTPNDSIWMDLGFPVMHAPDGRMFKAMFAPLIQDLDGRVNLNTAGNILGQQNNPPTTLSHQGWCGGEVNPSRVLTGGDSANLLTGFRYNPTWTAANLLANPYTPGGHFYSASDINCTPNPPSGKPAAALVMPQASTYFAFPWYNSPYQNGWITASEKALHPNLYNYFACDSPYIPAGTANYIPAQNWYGNAVQTNINNYRFPPSDMEALLRYGDRGSPALGSTLFNLCPTSLNPANNPAARHQVTTLSMDLARPGVMPSMYIQAGGGTYTIPTNNNQPAPQSGAPNYVPQYPTQTQMKFPPAVKNGEFNSNGTYYAQANGGPVLNRIDLNRGFTDYPPVSATTNMFTNYSSYQGYAGMNYGSYTSYGTYSNYSLLPTTAPNPRRPAYPYPSAMGSRVQMAQEIFNVLCVVTGVNFQFNTPSTPTYSTLRFTATPGTPQYYAIQWLAQLAVNIVDFVSFPGPANPGSTPPDDVMTMFCWNPGQNSGANAIQNAWVFGTVLPRLVINEAYAEIVNTQTDVQRTKPPTPVITQYNVNTWVELYNPFSSDTAANICNVSQSVPTALNGTAQLYVGTNGQANNNTTNFAAYRILVAQTNQGANNNAQIMTQSNNVLGVPQNICAVVNNFSPAASTTILDSTTGQVPNPKQTTVLASGSASLNQVQPVNGSYSSRNGAVTTAMKPGPQGNNQGFYVVGAPVVFPGNSGQTQCFATCPADNTKSLNLPASDPIQANIIGGVTTNGMQYTYSANPSYSPILGQLNHTFVLQRLACPYMPPNFTPTSPNFNPYVTVDYLQNVPLQDAVAKYYASTGNPSPTFVQPQNRFSAGRNQPYAASQLMNQQSTSQGYQTTQAPVINNGPQNTFFYPNVYPQPQPGQPPFGYDWMFWPNRMLVSPMELLHVSGYAPSQLTQMFINPNNTPTNVPQVQNKFMHRAPWYDPSCAIYRALEFFEAGLRPQWAPIGGRYPGRININTIWDYPAPGNPAAYTNKLPPPPTFMALCDPQGNNYFLQQAVSDMYTNMLYSRSPNGAPSPSDKPFLSLAGPYSTGSPPTPYGVPSTDINNTFLMQDTPGYSITPTKIPPAPPMYTTSNSQASGSYQSKRLFEVNPAQTLPSPPGGALPNGPEMGTDPVSGQTIDQMYLKNELMIKLFNNITTRSNVFAVWLTVGFFEVLPGGAYGQEINRAEGRNVRHRMFAIIDRTNLTINVETATSGRRAAATTTTTVYAQEPGPRPFFVNCPAGALSGATSLTIPASTSNNYEEMTWGTLATDQWPISTTAPYNQLVVDNGPNQEIVMVRKVSGGGTSGLTITLSTALKNTHDPGFAVSNAVLGHPGPQPYFDPRNPAYSGVVRYFSIIQ